MKDTTKLGDRTASPRSSSPAARRRRFEGGQSLLEFALMLPFMCLLSVGVVEIGRAAYASIIVTNAATAGVEYGSQSITYASDTNGMVTAATNDAKNNAVGGSMTAVATYGCTCDNGAGTSCTYPVPAQSSCSGIACTGQIVECVQVTTHISFTPLFKYPGLPTTYQSNGRSVMRVRH